MEFHEAQRAAMQDVLSERARQERKWGEQNHDPFTYLAVLTEEVGELSQAALHTKFGGDKADGLYTEAVHVAAVALAIVESLRRGKWAWPATAEDLQAQLEHLRPVAHAAVAWIDAEPKEDGTELEDLIAAVGKYHKQGG